MPLPSLGVIIMSKKAYKGYSWFPCPVCGAPAGDPCKNYKGKPKASCPRRKQLDEIAMRSIPVRRTAKPAPSVVYAELFPADGGEDV